MQIQLDYYCFLLLILLFIIVIVIVIIIVIIIYVTRILMVKKQGLNLNIKKIEYLTTEQENEGLETKEK
jgi:hypothetical protein